MSLKESSKNLTAFIFARGGSKSIPKKNLQVIQGIPLIGHAIQCGLTSRFIKRVIVSTDCSEIAAVSRDFGAETPFMRPESLATDTSSELLSWQHAIQSMSEYFHSELTHPFISLPATSPLRSPQDIDRAIEKFSAKTEIDVLFAISPSRRNPYLNMVTIGDDDLIRVVMDSSATRRQDVPEVYDISTVVYVAKPQYVLNCKKIMEGRVGYIKIPPQRSIDIDDKYDLRLAQMLISQPWMEEFANEI